MFTLLRLVGRRKKEHSIPVLNVTRSDNEPLQWDIGDRFQLTKDDDELIRLCKLTGIKYGGGYANGWVGTIVRLEDTCVGVHVAYVNYDHKPKGAIDAIPLAAATLLISVSDWKVGDKFRLTDDDDVFVRTCQLFGIKYKSERNLRANVKGGFAHGWEGTIVQIDGPIAAVHYSHKRKRKIDEVPLSAVKRVSIAMGSSCTTSAEYSNAELATARSALTIAMEPPVDIVQLKRALARGFQVELDDTFLRRASEVFASCIPLDLEDLQARGLSEAEISSTIEASGTVNFNFLLAKTVLEWNEARLPIYSRAKSTGMLATLPVRRVDVCIGLYKQECLAVSHRWNSPNQPDDNGEQLRAIKDHLRENYQIKYVFVDFSCLPQGKRTKIQELEFHCMLQSMSLIYLGCSVLVLMDRSTLCRFWTQFEAWLSMQEVGVSGLEPTQTKSRRFTVIMQHGAPGTLADALKEEWADCSVTTACTKLNSPDVEATNLKDKEILLPRIMAFADEVRRNVVEIKIRREEASRRRRAEAVDRWRA